MTLGIEDPWNPGLTTLEALRTLTVGCEPGQNRRFLEYPVKLHIGDPPANGLSLIGNIDSALNQPNGQTLVRLVTDPNAADVVFVYDRHSNYYQRGGTRCEFTTRGILSLSANLFEVPSFRPSAPIFALHEIMHALGIIKHIDGPAYINSGASSG